MPLGFPDCNKTEGTQQSPSPILAVVKFSGEITAGLGPVIIPLLGW